MSLNASLAAAQTQRNVFACDAKKTEIQLNALHAILPLRLIIAQCILTSIDIISVETAPVSLLMDALPASADVAAGKHFTHII